jgi:hypothetical protein
MQYREYMRKIYDIFIKNSFYLKKNEIEKIHAICMDFLDSLYKC